MIELDEAVLGKVFFFVLGKGLGKGKIEMLASGYGKTERSWGTQKKTRVILNIEPIFKNSTDLEPQENSASDESLEPRKFFSLFQNEANKVEGAFWGKRPHRKSLSKIPKKCPRFSNCPQILDIL